MIYVVHDYDYVAYAGTSLNEAASHVRGSGLIQVWRDGVQLASLHFNFQSKKWVEV